MKVGGHVPVTGPEEAGEPEHQEGEGCPLGQSHPQAVLLPEPIALKEATEEEDNDRGTWRRNGRCRDIC